MLQYVIAGLVLGGIYSIVAAGLVVTYRSAGILNFGFGGMAYFVARFYYFLNTQHGWSIPAAAIVAVVLGGPLLGVALYLILFRYLRTSPPLITVVATIGLAVAIPPLAALLFGNVTILKVPGLAPQPVRVFQFAGVPVTMDQLIVYASVVAIVVAGAVVLRYTDVGLRVRAMVDSPAMTSLSGTNPETVSIGVWAVSVFLAGLAGVLSAPIIGLRPGDYTLLMAAAFAAAIAARLRSLPTAVAVGLAMGVAGALIQRYLPSGSSFTAAVLPSIPFAVTALFLVYSTFRSERIKGTEGVGGPLDHAIAPLGVDRLAAGVERITGGARQLIGPGIVFAITVASVQLLSSFWVGFLAQGAAFAVIFLSFTLMTGEGGMIWLCQITFAGVGALTAAELATGHGWPVMAAVVVGGVMAVPIGVVLGVLTIRLGHLYVALVTLTFGLLMERLVFTRQIFANRGLGVEIERPSFATSDRAITYLAMGVFCLAALVIVNLRRSTTGLALNAVRWSEDGSKTLGLNVLQIKVLVSGLAAFVAGIGGALLAVANGVSLPGNYSTLEGLVWFAVVVTAGIRSNMAAFVAGITFTIWPAVMAVYTPRSFGQVPIILFGVGAVYIAKNPDGWVDQTGQQMRALFSRVFHRRAPTTRGGRSPAPDVLQPLSQAGPS